MPTLQDLIRTEDLTFDKDSTVIIDGPKDAIRITVIDNKKKCPRGNIHEVYMGRLAGEWYYIEEIDPLDPKLRPRSFSSINNQKWRQAEEFEFRQRRLDYNPK